MLYAVDLINNDSTLLPKVKLGVDIKDTCGSVDYAIMESLSFDFIRKAFTASEPTDCAEPGKSRDSAGDKFASHSVGQKLNGSFSGLRNSRSLSREESNISGWIVDNTAEYRLN